MVRSSNMSRLMQWPKSSSIKSSTWSHVFHIFSQEYITKLKKPASAHCFLFLIAVEKINVFFDFLFGMLDSFSHQCSDFAERESPRGNGQCTNVRSTHHQCSSTIGLVCASKFHVQTRRELSCHDDPH